LTGKKIKGAMRLFSRRLLGCSQSADQEKNNLWTNLFLNPCIIKYQYRLAWRPFHKRNIKRIKKRIKNVPEIIKKWFEPIPKPKICFFESQIQNNQLSFEL
jgi:hypothetical protein